ncbi:HNH endonuclease signature motif containing protein [Pedobacter agri]|uniref:HNH endonuclease signature motif containing protein n=1 Tax=Pedobacter agri TaxID=454586 RepID=A0A9X3DFD6_9SPHI|nr:HNH endonuclease signature motif containing protein [Pedobacter agri]MCX3266454.1 HNH endonuclease signature motif containing protein [Pedobacter agri]
MANLFNLDDDKRVVYKNELYSVRDNGMVYRHPKAGGRTRKYDNQWTYGNVNINNGYLEIASATIHRIVATAFHGEAPTREHVVDHIDTNRQNNRPENLRWVTRLENILLNPITCSRIATICGSVEAFLSDPAKFRDVFPDPRFDWMCTVSKEEAEASKQRLLSWASSGKILSGGYLSSWIYEQNYEETQYEVFNTIDAITPNAIQRNWQIPSEFPCCPEEYAGNPIEEYCIRLKEGAIFCKNTTYSSAVCKSTIGNGGKSIYVMTRNLEEDSIKGWALAEITFEDGMFIHTSKGTFFKEQGAEKYYTIAQGLEWKGGDGIDDYC